MNDIYGISWISPRWGFTFCRGVRGHRALPYASALTPSGFGASLRVYAHKAESLLINSIGQRPMKKARTKTTSPEGA